MDGVKTAKGGVGRSGGVVASGEECVVKAVCCYGRRWDDEREE